MKAIDILLKKGILTDEQLDAARKEVQKTGVPLENAIIRLGFITQEDMAKVVADEVGIPYMDLTEYIIDPEVIKYIPEQLAKQYKIVPLFKIGNSLTIAVKDPLDIISMDEIRRKTGFNVIDTVLSTEKSIDYAINQYYGISGGLEEVVKEISKKEGPISEEISTERLGEIASEVPVVKLANMLITDAVKDRASDIHIEPEEEFLRIRYRIDGILHEITKFPRSLHSPLVSRIKVLSKLDIAERRKPQDGRFIMKMQNMDLDVRVSIFPTTHGENVVLRLLNKETAFLRLTELGMSQNVFKRYDALIRQPHGIILVTGPTGSGKTTTLYASLSTINSIERNIITIEDPIEYELPLIRQTQVNPKIGITFSSGLRSILRQDPDIIMVGEIRDKETADIAIQAALTGHLVFSTLHTNDAPSAVTRLIEMGVEPFLISSTVIGVLAQRLVRVICDKCKEEYRPSGDILKNLGIETEGSFFHGKGCKNCKGTGFWGRTGLFELFIPDTRIKNAVAEKVSSEELHRLAVENGMVVLYQDGLKKVRDGVTTIEEVLRVTKEEV